MRINNTIAAMNTHRQYTINTNSVSEPTEKPSSDNRANRAEDGAAGLAVSEKMRAQIQGLKVASKNSSDAISLVQTAEGALQESHSTLQRMRELAVLSASDTNEPGIDRAALDAAFQQSIKKIDNIAGRTRFNDMGVIDGSYAGTATANVANGTVFTAGAGLVGDGQYAFEWVMGDDFTLQMKNPDGHVVGEMQFTNQQVEALDLKGGEEMRMQLNDGSALRFTPAGTAAIGTAAQLKAAVSAALGAGTVRWEGKPITIAEVSAANLGVDTLSIADGASARKATPRVNDAASFVSTQRAALGALQGRLNHEIQNLDTSAENLSAAGSRIRDLDMASEMTGYTRNNILQQAGTAVRAQANAAPEGVLTLLEG